MLKAHFDPKQPMVREGETPRGRRYCLAENANSGLPTLYIFEMPDGKIEEQLHEHVLGPDSLQVQTKIACEKNVASIEILSELTSEQIDTLVKSAETLFEQGLYRQAKLSPEAQISEVSRKQVPWFLYSTLLFSCVLIAISLRFLPVGAVPDDLSYCVIGCLFFSGIVSYLVRKSATTAKILIVCLFFCVSLVGLLWSNALTLKVTVERGKVMQIVRGSPLSSAPFVFRILREPDLKEISIITNNDLDLAVGDTVTYEHASGVLQLPSTINLSLAKPVAQPD